MTEVRALDILLHDRCVGTITALDGASSIFTFVEDYLPTRTGTLSGVRSKERYRGL